MRRSILALATALLILVTGASSASAYTYGKPSGKWFEAIITHESYHCLGGFTHTAYPHIARPSLNPRYINSGAHPYTPTSTDRARLQRSRVNSVAGEDNTGYVPYPFIRDYVPVYNKTGRAAAFTAIDRLDYGTDFNIVPVTYEPANGITIVWAPDLAGRSIGGEIRYSWTWNGSFWQVSDCTVALNPYVVT
jgi:hypothetical protein